MAKRIIAPACGAATSPNGESVEGVTFSNVIALPLRTQPTKARRGRKRQSCPVLKFTREKRFNYDREQLLAECSQGMQETLMKAYLQAARGEMTGLVLLTTNGDGNDKSAATLRGVYAKDKPAAVHLLKQHHGLAQRWARGEAVRVPESEAV